MGAVAEVGLVTCLRMRPVLAGKSAYPHGRLKTHFLLSPTKVLCRCAVGSGLLKRQVGLVTRRMSDGHFLYQVALVEELGQHVPRGEHLFRMLL